jgi:hypothetical protein
MNWGLITELSSVGAKDPIMPCLPVHLRAAANAQTGLQVRIFRHKNGGYDVL